MRFPNGSPPRRLPRAPCGAALAVFLVALGVGPAAAGIPCIPPDVSFFEYSPSVRACQYEFNADGGFDELTVNITLLDCTLTPISFCDVEAVLEPNAGTEALCGCEPLSRTVMTDAAGAATWTFSRIGGRGTMDLRLTAHCIGSVDLWVVDLPFTSPDLDGSCDPAPASSTGVVDLGIWAQILTSYYRPADMDCSGYWNIPDLGVWSYGLGVGCE